MRENRWLATCRRTDGRTTSPINSSKENSKGRRCSGDEKQLHRWTCIQTDFPEKTWSCQASPISIPPLSPDPPASLHLHTHTLLQNLLGLRRHSQNPYCHMEPHTRDPPAKGRGLSTPALADLSLPGREGQAGLKKADLKFEFYPGHLQAVWSSARFFSSLSYNLHEIHPF